MVSEKNLQGAIWEKGFVRKKSINTEQGGKVDVANKKKPITVCLLDVWIIIIFILFFYMLCNVPYSLLFIILLASLWPLC